MTEMAKTPTEATRGGGTPKASVPFPSHEQRNSGCRRRYKINGYKILPSYERRRTRPGKVVNPFNDFLVQRMSDHVCSPDMFVRPRSPLQRTEFHWTIEDIARMRPAVIESPATETEDCIDEETESQVQEAIEQYFSTTHNITSPADAVIGSWVSPTERNTPEVGGFLHNAVSTPCTRQSKPKGITADASLQTIVSLPENLPKELLDALRPYMNDRSTDCSINEDANLSVNTLRRKLFHQEDDDISPVKRSDSELHHLNRQSNQWTPERGLPPPSPDISPIQIEPTSLFHNMEETNEENRIEIFSSTQGIVKNSEDLGYYSTQQEETTSH